MRNLLIIVGLLSGTMLLAQPTYYHDSSLDAIQNNVGYLHYDNLTNQGQLGQINASINNLTNFTGGGLTSNDMVNGAGYAGSAILNTITAQTASGATNGSISISNVFANSDYGLTGALATSFSSIGTNYFNDGQYTNPAGLTINLGTLANGSGSTTFVMDLMELYNSTVFQLAGGTTAGLILLLASLIYAVFIIKFLQKEMVGLLQQQQIRGSKQEAFAANAAFPTSILFAVVITAVLVASVGFLITRPNVHNAVLAGATFPTALNATMSNYGDTTHTAISTAWAYVTSIFPVGGLFALWLQYILFRYVYGMLIFNAIHAFIFWLSGGV